MPHEPGPGEVPTGAEATGCPMSLLLPKVPVTTGPKKGVLVPPQHPVSKNKRAALGLNVHRGLAEVQCAVRPRHAALLQEGVCKEFKSPG